MNLSDCLLDSGAFKGFYTHHHPLESRDIFSTLRTKLNDPQIPEHDATRLIRASDSHTYNQKSRTDAPFTEMLRTG